MIGQIIHCVAARLTLEYDGSAEADIRTEVTFEDGRKGVIAARVKVRDCKTYPVAGGSGAGGGGMRAPGSTARARRPATCCCRSRTCRLRSAA